MSTKKKTRHVEGMKTVIKKKTQENVWAEDQENEPVDLRNFDSKKLIDAEWLRIDEESYKANLHGSCTNLSEKGIVSKTEHRPKSKRLPSQQFHDKFDQTCANTSKEFLRSSCEIVARPTQNMKSEINGEQRNYSKVVTEEKKKKRISLRVSKENGAPDDNANEHWRDQESYFDSDKTSDYGTLQEGDVSSDDESNDYINNTTAFSRSVPNLSTHEKLDEDIKDLRPLSKCYVINVENSKNFNITPDRGTASFTKTTVNRESHGISEGEHTRKAQTYKDRHVTVLRSVRRTYLKVDTELFKGGKTSLNREDYYPLVIFKGSGYGCGFAAKMLFENAVSENRNTSAYYLKTADELSNVGTDEKAIVLILDANGPTGSDIMRLDTWYEVLKERVPLGPSTKENLTIIMTLQDFSTQQKKVHPILKKYSEYVVDASKKRFRPDTQTKEMLKEALLRQKNVRINPVKGRSPVQPSKDGKLSLLDKEIADSIVPLLGSVRYIGKLAEFFRSDMSDGLNSLRKPIPELVQRIRKSYEDGDKLFLTLLAVYVHGGQLGVGRINQMRKLNEHTEKFWNSADNIDRISKKKSKKIKQQFNSVPLTHLYTFAAENGHLMNLGNNLQKYCCCLDGELLAEKNDVYRFCDGRVYYSFQLVYCEKYSTALDYCENHFFFNFVKSSRIEDEKDIFLLVDNTTLNDRTKAVMKRFSKEMMLRHVAKCMKHPIMSTTFFQLFLTYLEKTRHLLWQVLTQQDCDPTEPYSCLYHGLDELTDTFRGVPRNNTEVIILHEIWKKKRRKQRWKAWMKAQESETLVRAAEISNCKTFELLVTKGAEIPIEALKKAIDVGAEDIIKFIMQTGHFCPEEWHEAAQHATILISNGEVSQSLLLSLKSVIAETDVNVGTESKPPLIHFAVQTKNAKLLKLMLDGNIVSTAVDVDKVYRGETALTVATRLGSHAIVEILLEKRATHSQTEVFIASSLGHVEVLEKLIYKNPMYIFLEDSKGLTPLFYAVVQGHTEVVAFLLSKYAENNRPCSTTSTGDDTLQVIHPQAALDRAEQTFFKQKRNSEGQTALHVAAKRGCKEIIVLLLSHGFDLRIKDYNNETPLSLACISSNIQGIRVILSNWNLREYIQEERVVMRAVKNGDDELLELLIEYGYGFNFVNEEYGAPLLVAIQYGMHDMVRFLLSNGADPEILQNGHRPVHIAADKGDTESLKILQEFEANIAAKTDGKGDDIIHIATEKGHFRFVETVFAVPGNLQLIDMRNVHGETALHAASKIGCSSLVKLLLQCGFNPKIQSRNGELPAKLAEKALEKAISSRDKEKWNSYADCVQILQMH